jgi:tetratricopeptide (TPR) repeat protein
MSPTAPHSLALSSSASPVEPLSGLEGLDEATGRRLARVCLWPGTLTTGLAAALLETSAEEADELLERLLRADLLDCVGEEHYRLFGAARDHAEALTASVDPDERSTALARGIHHCLRVAAAADFQLCPGLYRSGWPYGHLAGEPVALTVGEALTRLDAAVPDLLVGQQIAMEIDLDELAYPVAEILTRWLELRRDHAVWTRVCERSIEAARRCRHRAAEATATLVLARGHHERGEHARALELARHALRLSWSVGDPGGAASALMHLGELHLAAGDPDEAISALTGAQDLVDEDSGCVWLLAVVRRRLGVAHAAADRLDTARGHLGWALALWARLDDGYQHGQTLTDLAEVELRAGQVVAAKAALGEALDLLADAGPYACARVHRLLAVPHLENGELETARRHIGRAIELYRDAAAATSHPEYVEAAKVACRLGVPETGPRSVAAASGEAAPAVSVSRTAER